MAALVPHGPVWRVTLRSMACAGAIGLHHHGRCHPIAGRSAVWSAASVRGFSVERFKVAVFDRLARRSFKTPIPNTLKHKAAEVVAWLSTCVDHDDYARATVPLDGGDATMPTTLRNAVIPTAMAPTTEKMTCQVSDGMVCLTMP